MEREIEAQIRHDKVIVTDIDPSYSAGLGAVITSYWAKQLCPNLLSEK
jgi:hypothetical protein